MSGAVKVPVPPPVTLMSVLVPTTVTVWAVESWFFTMTLAPAATVSAENLNPEMVRVASDAAAGAAAVLEGCAVDVDGAMEDGAIEDGAMDEGAMDADAAGAAGVEAVLEQPAVTARAAAARAKLKDVLRVVIPAQRLRRPDGSTTADREPHAGASTTIGLPVGLTEPPVGSIVTASESPAT